MPAVQSRNSSCRSPTPNISAQSALAPPDRPGDEFDGKEGERQRDRWSFGSPSHDCCERELANHQSGKSEAVKNALEKLRDRCDLSFVETTRQSHVELRQHRSGCGSLG
jgi:hypothetical protein